MALSHELTKELKDAGFPQKEEIGAHYLTPQGLHAYYPDTFSKEAYVPTLSELIDACGKPFGLTCTVSGEWYAQNSPEKIFGLTPEEAVAKLWLALHHNKI